MLESTKAELRASDIRKRLSELQTTDVADNAATEEIEKLTGEYKAVECRRAAALISEQAERNAAKVENADGEKRDWEKLMSEYRIQRVAASQLNGSALDGVEKEVAEELGADNSIPLETLALSTSANLDGTKAESSLAPVERLFENTAASRVGFSTMSMGRTLATIPVFTGSASATWTDADANASVDASAVTSSSKSLSPKQALVSADVPRATLLTISAASEAAIRRELLSVLTSAVDAAAIAGTGTGNQPTGMIKAAGNVVDPAQVNVTYDHVNGEAWKLVDGKQAMDVSGVYFLCRPEVASKLDASAWDDGSGVTAWDKLKMNFNGASVSGHIAAPASNISQAVVAVPSAGIGIVGVWESATLLVNPYSGSKKGVVSFDCSVYVDVAVTRGAGTNGSYRVIKIKTA